MDENNPLTGLLRSGFSYGSDWASNKLFGSKPASNESLQVEKVARGQLNGSGPVNAAASVKAPSTWTEFFFGSRAGPGTDGSLPTGGTPPIRMIVLSVIGAIVAWYLIKKFR